MNPRSTAWNERISTLEQERQFTRLISLHTLTDSWIKTMSPKEEPTHRMERMTKITLNPNLWQFEKTRLDHLAPKLEDLVGAQDLESFLKELQETIWIIQASTLENALGESQQNGEIENVLQQSSWNHGKVYAEGIWGAGGAFSLHEAAEGFLQSHFYGQSSFLKERVSESEISLIWARSPLQNPTVNASISINLLCSLHEHWIKGFIYGISRKTRVHSGRTLILGHQHPHFTLL